MTYRNRGIGFYEHHRHRLTYHLTLYSILNALNTSDRKIITLEDPVENTIPGITQIPTTASTSTFSWSILAGMMFVVAPVMAALYSTEDRKACVRAVADRKSVV